MYALLKRCPCIMDAHACWRTGYMKEYGTGSALSLQYQHICDNYDYQGIVLSEDDRTNIEEQLHPVGYGDVDVSFFQSSLGKLRLRHANNYWHANKSFFPAHITSLIPGHNPVGGQDTVGVSMEENLTPSFISQNDEGPVSVVATSASGNEVLSQVSQYMVPSQNNASESRTDHSPCPPQGHDAYNDFMHIYSTLCKLTDSNGQAGRDALLQGLNKLKAEQHDISGVTLSENTVSSGPKLSNKRKATRKKAVTSPRKK